MKFRLSTVFLLILCAALALGWYADRTSRSRRDLLGAWCFPTKDLTVTGYSSLLEIRADGSFTKTQSGHLSEDRFEGKYVVDDDGRVVFTVTSKTTRTLLDDVFKEQPKTEKLNVTYECRCATDPAGFLVIDTDHQKSKLRSVLMEEDIGISWETCERVKK